MLIQLSKAINLCVYITSITFTLLEISPPPKFKKNGLYINIRYVDIQEATHLSRNSGVLFLINRS